MWQIAIDTGGTFTDCYGKDPGGQVFRFKVLSAAVLRGTIKKSSKGQEISFNHNWPIDKDIFQGYQFRLLSSDQSFAISKIDFSNNIIELKSAIEVSANSIFEISANEEAPVLATRIITKTPLGKDFPPIKLHIGTTKGTNAILEKKGARTGVLLTKGFKDLMVIDNQQRPHLFQLDIPDRQLYYDSVLEIDERIDANGKVLTPLTDASISIKHFIEENELDSVAISLVNAYTNPKHEVAVEKSVRNYCNNVSVSTRLSPTIHYLKRTKTTVINAYLQPIIDAYVNNINTAIGQSDIYIMKSSGGLIKSSSFVAKDSLLSGPAGGVVGIAAVGQMINQKSIIGIDMGGTSTDVARYDGRFDYVDELTIGGTTLKTPAMNIHTVAAGGGSIVSFQNGQIHVGPESAGSFPGPACYGAGGPLTITDVNLLLNKIHPDTFKIPIDKSAAEDAFQLLKNKMAESDLSDKVILEGIEQIANEKMAQAIRQISIAKGFDPSEYILCGYGGAGGLHACAIADILDIKEIVLPYDAGILSAFGIFHASLERSAKLQVLAPLVAVEENINGLFKNLEDQVIREFSTDNIICSVSDITHHFIYLRLKGQSNCIELDRKENTDLESAFAKSYRSLYGYYPNNPIIEVERIEVIGQIKQVLEKETKRENSNSSLNSDGSFIYPIIDHDSIHEGVDICGPAILRHQNSTAFIPENWKGTADKQGNVLLKKDQRNSTKETIKSESIHQSLFTNRFMAIADEMGHQLQRTSFSVNIKERLDFSCAILNEQGRLLVNAPHIPVHLGSLGICGRLMIAARSLNRGDVLLTNHPMYGGSHLPDLTMMAAAFTEDNKLIGYLINRAHHAEIGGSKPGSMPPDAKSLDEEGVTFTPFYLIKDGVFQEKELLNKLNNSTYPSRQTDHNIADLKAGIASLEFGRKALIQLTEKYGLEKVHHYMNSLTSISSDAILQADLINEIINNGTEYHALESIDDGHQIQVRIYGNVDKVIFDFDGTSGVHPDNLNANISIIYSAVLYVLRLLIKDDIPLNEGFLNNVIIEVPKGTFLNPDFEDDAQQCPAVVGGNTEISQRVVDTLIKAFGLSACSQGTMNNFLFGNDRFGYYETICGGVGAGNGFDGRSASHQHMTNTRITDIEELENNYPVLLNEFSIQENSGGHGKYKGGDGIVRKLTFTEDVDMTIISQHREISPYGLLGGEDGSLGEQFIKRKSGEVIEIKGIGAHKMEAGDSIEIRTPGGGGYLKDI